MKTTRKVQSEKTKKIIFQTAICLFNKYGYNNVTVEQICNNANIAKGTFYVHYKTKDDIPKEMYRTMIQNHLDESMKQYVKDYPKATAREKLLHHCVSVLKFCKDTNIESTLLSYIANLKSIINTKETLFSNEFDTYQINKIIKECLIENNTYSDKHYDDIRYFITTILNGMMIQWCFSYGEYDIVNKNMEYLKNSIELI